MLAAFTVAIFVGAALLFLVQPMVAKMLLPLLGGSPAVWNTCMVFFQAALLAGYAYAHWSVKALGPRRQAILHFLVILAPLAVLPVALRGGEPPAEGSPVGWLLWALAATIGLPFIVAATGGPLLQRWFASTGHRAAHDPYFLYAASNAGSLLALLAYPFLIEPLATLGQQRLIWSAGYLLFAILTIACGIIVIRRATTAATVEAPAAPAPNPAPSAPESTAAPAPPGAAAQTASAPNWRLRLWWVLMAFIPSSLMLGVTQYMSTDIAAVPLLWIVPLSMYLLTFIFAFASRQFVSTQILSRILPLLVVALAVAFLTRATTPILLLIPLHLATFFIAALLCHLRLAQTRPHTSRLTEFYLLIAIGGVLGGIFNALVAPVVFTAVAEYPIAIALACLARTPARKPQDRKPWLAPALDYGAPILLGLIAFFGAQFGHTIEQVLRRAEITTVDLQLVLSVGIPAFGCYLLAVRRIALATGVGALFAVALIKSAAAGGVIYNERTFYGVHRVRFNAPFVELVHNNTSHGIQARDPVGKRVPLAYYSPQGPIGEVFDLFHASELFRHIGVVGLGSGTLAAYGQPGQRITFHEIDPAIVGIASTHFTYLTDTPATWEVKLGDGRLTLAEVPDGTYGLLVVDAFSSDAIPVHLLTREAVALYIRKLDQGGFLAFHISNRYLNLLPVLERIAEDQGLALLHRNHPMDHQATLQTGVFGSHWVLLGRSRLDFGPLVSRAGWEGPSTSADGPLWTDDYSNIISVFSVRGH